ncbi:hypothetical protein JCM11491_006096 [Sporobolomyces phaffii]
MRTPRRARHRIRRFPLSPRSLNFFRLAAFLLLVSFYVAPSLANAHTLSTGHHRHPTRDAASCGQPGSLEPDLDLDRDLHPPARHIVVPGRKSHTIGIFDANSAPGFSLDKTVDFFSTKSDSAPFGCTIDSDLILCSSPDTRRLSYVDTLSSRPPDQIYHLVYRPLFVEWSSDKTVPYLLDLQVSTNKTPDLFDTFAYDLSLLEPSQALYPLGGQTRSQSLDVFDAQTIFNIVWARPS